MKLILIKLFPHYTNPNKNQRFYMKLPNHKSLSNKISNTPTPSSLSA